MSGNKKVIHRRTFIKLSFVIGVMTGIGPVAAAIGISDRCNGCGIDLLGNKLVSRLGCCRNCGARVYSGRRDLPSLPYRASERSRDDFTVLELPFPNLDISQWTAKPCFSLRQIRPGISRVRVAKF